MDLECALDRVGHTGGRAPDLATLEALQRAFLLSVPFENLDIHLGRPITVTLEHAYAKIVEARRGGFCYECNGLFAAMLEALGFRVTILSARMALGGRVSPEFGHMVLRVDLDVPYLVDVGNGESCRAPLRFDGANERDAEGKTYRVGSHDATPALMFRTQDDPWRPRFLIDATPRRREEFAAMCRFHQTSPESHFTRQRLVTLATDRGRLTVVDRRFTETDGDQRQERELRSDAEYRQCLREQFALELE